MQSESINELVTALCKVQAEMRGAIKDSSNPFFKSSYADLESCWEALRAPLTKNGLAVIQTTGIENGETCVVTTLAHSSGQWIRGVLPVRSIKADPQAQGAAITYARRYALAAITGLIQVDDDAESAMDRGREKAAQVNSNFQNSPTSFNGNPADFVIPFGKAKGQKLGMLNDETLMDMATWLRGLDNPKGSALQCLNAVNAYMQERGA